VKMMKTSSDRFVHDRDTWNDYIKMFDLDVYYEYDYLTLDCEPGDTPELFIYSDQDRTMLYPYVCRRIEGTSYFDTLTAYGYGGPVFFGPWTPKQVADARSAFLTSCRSRSVITETVRFHPLLNNAALGRGWVDICRAVRPTTAVDLRRPLTDVLADIDGRSQRNIRKALRETVTVREGDSNDLAVFIKLYWETMARRHAEDWYYFGQDYFNSLFLSDRIDTELLVAEWGSEIIAGCLIMYSSKYSHYHLGASSLAHLSHRPNHLLFREMIVQAHRKGKDFLHLGGGTTGDASDSLLGFKKSFTAGREETFYLGQSILDQPAYSSVCRDFLSQHRGAEASDWFPLYRTPLPRGQVTEKDSS
jgi:hypothetical protein